LSDPRDVENIGEWLRKSGRDVDVLVNNAGSPAPASVDDLTSLATSWIETYRANVVSAVLLTAELEGLLTRPGGRVVLVGSRAALNGGASAAYVAAKAALHGWVLALAARLGPAGITVNAVAPGFTEDTELVVGRVSPQRRDRIVGGIASGRPGKAREIAAAIEFLASPTASFVNGQVLSVDGGLVPAG
jgi:3-oxoacyl-[acyl-carrier protein] reductase